MSHELKELTFQEIEFVSGGNGMSPSQAAALAAATKKDTETPQTGALLDLLLRTPMPVGGSGKPWWPV